MIDVRETAGIRRTQFPVEVEVTLPEGGLTDATRVRLTTGGAETPGQFSPVTRWPDGSIERLGVNFNVSIGPGESQPFRLEYGSGVAPSQPPRGLTVSEDQDAIQVGNIQFGRSGSPLVASASYRAGEFIGSGPNTVSLLDRAGRRRSLAEARDLRADVLKPGPLMVVLRYTGRIPLEGSATVPVTVTVELPNSKAWFKAAVEVKDSDRQVREVAFETPVAFGAYPWTWDVGTANGTYGAFRGATDAMALDYVVPPAGSGTWRVDTGTEGELRPYETSTAGRPVGIAGWWHFQDSDRAVAFIVEGFGTIPATYRVRLNGRGHTSFAVAPAGTATVHAFTLYQHFVSTPVAIGAATSPASALSPLQVTVR